jgi:hypothetical protein
MRTAKLRLSSFGEVQVVVGVRSADLLKAAYLRELFQCIFTYGRQHPESRLAVGLLSLPEEALVKEGFQMVYQIAFSKAQFVGDVGYRIEGTTSGEDGYAGEEFLLSCGEQIIAPVDGVAKGLLASGKVTRAAGEEGQALI